VSPEGAPQKKSGALKWVGIGCLLLVLAGGGCFVGCIMIARGAMTGSEAYKMALDNVSKHAEVVEKLGSQLTPGFLPRGNISIQGATGSAALAIPVSGPKGQGTIIVEATKAGGKWTINSLTVTVAGTNEVITIIGSETPGKKPGGG